MTRFRPSTVAVLCVASLVAAACGSTSDATSSVPASRSPGSAQTAAAAASRLASGGSPAVPSGAVVPSDPPTPIPPVAATVTASLPIPGNPNGMLEAYGSVWVTSRHTGTVYRIDPATNQTTATIYVGVEPSYFVDDGNAVWVIVYGSGNEIARIDPKTNVIQLVQLGPAQFNAGEPIFGDGAVWVATEYPSVVKVDAKSAKVVATVPLPWRGGEGSAPTIAFANDQLWITDPTSGRISRVDAKSLATVDTLTVATHSDFFGLGSDGTSVWLTDGPAILRLDPATGQVQDTIAPPYGYAEPVLAGDSLWVGRGFGVLVAPIDKQTGMAGPSLDLPGDVTESVWYLSRGPHDLWVSIWDGNVIERIDPAP